MINDGKDCNETAWGVQLITQVKHDEFESYDEVNRVVNEGGSMNDDETCADGCTPHIKRSGWFRQVN